MDDAVARLKQAQAQLDIRRSQLRKAQIELERPADVAEDARPVYVHTVDGAIEVRWVETGITDGVYTEVLSGAEPGLRLNYSTNERSTPCQHSRRVLILHFSGFGYSIVTVL